MAGQHLFDLARGDVHAAADDPVRGAVREEQGTVVVEVADVADGERAVAPGRVGLRVVAVIGEARATRRRDVHDTIGTGRHRSTVGIKDADLDTGPRLADTARSLLPFLRTDARR